MQYKALISDVDGTLITYDLNALPSKRNIEAIHKAKDILHVGVATARPYFMMEKLFSVLDLSGPSIIAGGAQVYDTTTKKIVYENAMDSELVAEVIEKLQKYTPNFIVGDGKGEMDGLHGNIPNKPLQIYVYNLKETLADTLIEKFSSPRFSVHKIYSSKHQGKMDVEISDIKSTKQQGILKVAEILGIQTHEIIGIGDSYNDFPLLMACGLKVAVGNAAPELKEIADYVAPAMDEDGVADVIEKFVLNSS